MQTMRKRYGYEERLKLLEKTNGLCAHCGKQLKESDDMTVEHIMPISKGGRDDEFNLVALCKECNLKKSNDVYHISEYYSYISSEYIRDYIEYNLKAVNKYTGFNGLNCVITPNRAAYQVGVRLRSMYDSYGSLSGKNKRRKKAFEAFMTAQTTLKWCRAYDGDTREILNLLNRTNRKYNKIGLNINLISDCYNNDYAILGKIKSNMILTLRNNMLEIVGVVIFGSIDDLEFVPVQLKQMEEQTSLSAKYTIELICISDAFLSCYEEVRSDLFSSLIKQFYIPIEVVQDGNDKVTGSVQMPMKIHGMDMIAAFFTAQGLRVRASRMVDAMGHVADREFTESEKEKLVDTWLYGDRGLGTERLLIAMCELGADLSMFML